MKEFRKIEDFKNKIEELRKLAQECENHAKEKNDKFNYAYQMGKIWAYGDILDLIEITGLTTLVRDITQQFNFTAEGIRNVAKRCEMKAKECQNIDNMTKWQWWHQGKEQAYTICAEAIDKTIMDINGEEL